MSKEERVPLNKREFNYGGQAVIEGVMMRGSRALAVAVRDPQGRIVVHTEPLDARIYGGRLARIPFVRGLTLLWDALGLGVKSLMFSANVALAEEGEDEAQNVFDSPAQWGMVLFSLAVSILLFFLFPAFVGDVVARWLVTGPAPVLSNLIEGVIRLLLLIGYIWAIGQMADVRRLFGYHGAEHKTINAYEAGAPLTPRSVAEFSLQHPRCGTAFLLTVVVISILVYSLLPPLSLPVRLLSRVLLLPLIAGIAYEFIRFSARHQGNPLIRLLSRPNLAMQRLTTREPDSTMLAVAIQALEHVLAYEASTAPVVTGDVLADDLDAALPA
ncbi:MAG: DUF1385 domain-containing protein [Chloroflexi bacterium]|jgi:uncharacterized protein YqhQ|nr:DUF1385 domain-containing protein [Chloroflexota bacterium]